VRWMRWAPIGIAFALSLANPAGAIGLVLAPPGHAGTQQYFETIPTSSGSAAPPGTVSGSGINSGGTQPLARLGHGRAGAAKLAGLGSDGRAAANLATTTAPPVPAAATPNSAAAASNGSVASGLAHALTGSDSGGLGLLLPLLLATGFVAALGVILLRLRSSGRSVEPSS
jgi:hypothetical protein